MTLPPNNTLRIVLLTLACLGSILSAGCAQKPWKQPLAEGALPEAQQTIAEIQKRDAACTPCIDTEAKIFLRSKLQNQATSGYLQIQQPSFIKFIVSNPFGQPLLAVASDGINFQKISTPEQVYMNGKVLSFVLKNDLPIAIVNGQWGAWLTGRLGKSTLDVKNIYEDEQNRGFWIATSYQTPAGKYQEHLLINPQNKLLVGRMLTDQKDRILANVQYSQSKDMGGCPQPENLKITQLDFNTEIEINLADIQPLSSCSMADFSLKRPDNFTHLYLP